MVVELLAASVEGGMASVRAALVVLPPLSVLMFMAARCLCGVMARKLSALARSQLACLPSGGGPSSPSSVGGGELPVALYSRRTMRRRCCVGEEEQEEECVLCLSSIEEGSEVRELRCRHLFHRGCLDRWVRVAATCPLCRGRLLLEDDEEEEEGGDGEVEEEEEEDMMLFMACVHGRSSWLWPS